MGKYRLRLVRDEDCEAILRIYTPYVTDTAVSFEYEVPSAQAFLQRMRGICAFYPYLVCEDEAGRVIGYAYAGRSHARAAYDWQAELSIYVDPACHGAGVAHALYGALTAFLARQNIVKVLAIISLPNDRSVVFHKKQGFANLCMEEKAGYKQGKWRDLLTMEKWLCAPPTPPTPIISFGTLAPEDVRDVLAQHEQALNRAEG